MGEALASIAGGLGQGLVQAQELGMRRDYYSALKKQADADIKVAELKAQRELQRTDMLSKFLGGKPPSMPLAGAGQQPPQDGRVDIALGPNPTDANILAAYNKVQAAPAPQQGLPQQLAQAQMQDVTGGQMGQLYTPEGQIAFREIMGYDPPSGVGKIHFEKVNDERGTTLIPYDSFGRQVGRERFIPEARKIIRTTPEGAETEGIEYPPLGGVTTKPSPLDIRKPPPEDELKKLQATKSQLGELWDLAGLAAQRPDVVGLAGRLKYGMAENEFSAWFMKMFGTEPNPAITDFYKRLNKLQTTVIHEFAGSAVSAQELKRALAALPQASSPQQFIDGLRAVDSAYQRYEKDFYDFYSKTPRERTMGGTQGGSTKPNLQPGKNSTIGPTQRYIYDPNQGGLVPVQ